MEQIPTIGSSTDAPYIVKNLQEPKGADGTSLPSKAVMALCRCGGSATKPFCDGTHRGERGVLTEKIPTVHMLLPSGKRVAERILERVEHFRNGDAAPRLPRR